MARPKSAQATAAKAQDKQPQATAAPVQATAQSPVQASVQVPAGFTPVKYVFRRQAHTDALYGTRIVWDNPGDVRLYLNLGRRDQISEELLHDYFAQRGLGRLTIELHTTHTYLFVPEAQAEPTIAALNGGSFGGRSLICERARR